MNSCKLTNTSAITKKKESFEKPTPNEGKTRLVEFSEDSQLRVELYEIVHDSPDDPKEVTTSDAI